MPYQRLAPRPLLTGVESVPGVAPRCRRCCPCQCADEAAEARDRGRGLGGPHLWMLAFGLGECCAVFFYKTYRNRVVPASYAEKVLEFKLSVRSF